MLGINFHKGKLHFLHNILEILCPFRPSIESPIGWKIIEEKYFTKMVRLVTTCAILINYSA